jgi:hypothetical protein
MIKFKINEKTINYPTQWEDLTFGQYLQIFHLKGDTIQMVSILSGLDYEYLKTATIIGLESLLEASKFILVTPKFETYYGQIGPYLLPANRKGQFDIRFESMGQFEDMRAAMTKPKDIIEHTTSYGRYVAIYLQKIKDGSYSPNKVEAMEEEVKNYKACEVIAVGQFFFLKLYHLSSGTSETSPPTNPSPKKSKPALTTSKRNSASTRR